MSRPPLSEGLIAYYPFDGDAKDYSGNGNGIAADDSWIFAASSPGMTLGAAPVELDAHKIIRHNSNATLPSSAMDLRRFFKYKIMDPLDIITHLCAGHSYGYLIR
ncbi:MAG: hypothetical protein DRP64_09930 [Verrucomicrobia bacterium]|nr:MAG: hypothetical protein DRP64_09930 [Verrucomicrobiota bacterium]